MNRFQLAIQARGRPRLAPKRIAGRLFKERVVPIGRTAARWLQSYIQGVRPFLPGHDQTRRLFLKSRGLPLKIQNVQALVPHYAEKAKLEVHQTSDCPV